MTKKQLAGVAVILSGLFFILFLLYLPVEVAGRRPEMSRTLVVNSAFIAITCAVVLVFFLIVLTKREFVITQVTAFLRFRYLLALMVKRDFVTRYRRSVLGVLWSLLSPLLTMMVLTMVFSTLFRFEIEYFPVYLISGQMIFGFFSESTSIAMGSIVIGGGATVKKIYVPKYIFPLSKVMSSLVNVGFSLLAFFAVFLVTRAPFSWTILLLPVPIFYVFVFSVGVGMLLSAAAVFFRDLTYIYGVFITLLTFLTPIFYPVSILPERVYHLIHFNPIYHYVDYFRVLALHGRIPGLWSNIICLGFALAALCLGLYVKMSQQDKYILYL